MWSWHKSSIEQRKFKHTIAQYCTRSFIHGTNISQISSMMKIRYYIFTKLKQECFWKFLQNIELWEFHIFIFTNVSKIREIRENFVPWINERVRY